MIRASRPLPLAPEAPLSTSSRPARARCRTRASAVVAALLVLLGACSSEPHWRSADYDGDGPPSDNHAQPGKWTDPSLARLGKASPDTTSHVPRDIRNGIYTRDWDVDLQPPVDATATIVERGHAAAPPDGMAYWAVAMTAEYWGKDADVAAADHLRLSFVDTAGGHHTDCGIAGTLPGALSEPLYEGGPMRVDEGAFCVLAPVTARGTWQLEITGYEPIALTTVPTS